MFTVKVCNPGQTIYYETDAVTCETLADGHEVIRFSAQGEERCMAIRNRDDDGIDGPDPVTRSQEIPIINRAYLINDHGKTVDIFR